MERVEEFESVYNQYYGKVLNYIYGKISIHHDAEDMAQEIMFSCYKNWDSYDSSKASVSTWIYVAANNRLKNYYRDRKLLDSLDDEDKPFEIASGEMLLEDVVLLEEMKEILLSSFSILSERELDIVKKKYYEHKSSKEIAEELQITPVNARVILKRSVNKICNYFKQKGYTNIIN